MFFCLKGNYFAETFAELFSPRGEDKVSIRYPDTLQTQFDL